MKITGKKLISVTESDLTNGVFHNNEVTELSNGCFYNMPSLVNVILPKVEKCGDYCFRNNAALTSVSLPLLAQCGDYCFSNNAALTSVSLGKHKLSGKNVDGSYFVVESEKSTNGIKIYIGFNFLSIAKKIIQKQPCFVAEKDNFFAHGQTVKKAIADLRFKMVAEKLKTEPINSDTKITINHYRLITGACEMGVKAWMADNKLTGREEITAAELLPILKKTNAWGFERFQQLVTF